MCGSRTKIGVSEKLVKHEGTQVSASMVKSRGQSKPLSRGQSNLLSFAGQGNLPTAAKWFKLVGSSLK
jgi:hypothetical protein